MCPGLASDEFELCERGLSSLEFHAGLEKGNNRLKTCFMVEGSSFEVAPELEKKFRTWYDHQPLALRG